MHPLKLLYRNEKLLSAVSASGFPPSLNGKSSYTRTVIVTVSLSVHWLWFSVATGAWSRHVTIRQTGHGAAE